MIMSIRSDIELKFETFSKRMTPDSYMDRY